MNLGISETPGLVIIACMIEKCLFGMLKPGKYTLTAAGLLSHPHFPEFFRYLSHTLINGSRFRRTQDFELAFDLLFQFLQASYQFRPAGLSHFASEILQVPCSAGTGVVDCHLNMIGIYLAIWVHRFCSNRSHHLFRSLIPTSPSSAQFTVRYRMGDTPTSAIL
ncbi:uncharacterized protein BJX67DRAFT_339369 [Aspergillus lucknowensis]|uniref:Uncharacterized protein n=1 Tax=Aspergillus lucknowensis TaxID=176173 RepID=A0ABR4M702_9EURO